MTSTLKTLKTVVVACALAAVVNVAAADALAQPFAVVTVSNTTNGTVYYQFQWGNEGWYRYSLLSNNHRVHYHNLDANSNVPVPYITFNNGAGGDRNYNLLWFGSWAANYSTGRLYEFAWTGRTLDLYAKQPADEVRPFR